MNWNRRDFLKCALAAGSMALIPRFGGSKEALAETFQIHYGAHPTPEGFVWTSKDWTAKYNGNTKVSWFPSGGEADKALLAGKIDADGPGAGRLIGLNAAQPGGFSQLMVWMYGDFAASLVRPDAPYKNMTDLKGKKMGVTVGSGAYMCWLIYLDANGFTPEDFEIVNIRGGDIPSALASGMVDAVTVWEPFPSLMEYKGQARILALFGEWVYDLTLLQVRTDSLKKKRDLFVRMTAGALECQQFIRENPKEASKLISQGLAKQNIEVPPQAFETIITKRGWFKPDFNDDVRSSLNKLGKVALKLKRIKRMPQFTFATDVLEEAKKLKG